MYHLTDNRAFSMPISNVDILLRKSLEREPSKIEISSTIAKNTPFSESLCLLLNPIAMIIAAPWHAIHSYVHLLSTARVYEERGAGKNMRTRVTDLHSARDPATEQLWRSGKIVQPWT